MHSTANAAAAAAAAAANGGDAPSTPPPANASSSFFQFKNPSQRLTEFLSHYLELDEPASQLKVGLWSGHLSLEQVRLRPSAVEQALFPTSNSNQKSNRNKQRQSHQQQPPLRPRLVSGTIGSLRVQIPWKRLMWGGSSGDAPPKDPDPKKNSNNTVQIDLCNIVLVLAWDNNTNSNTKNTSDVTSQTDRDEDPLYFPEEEPVDEKDDEEEEEDRKTDGAWKKSSSLRFHGVGALERTPKQALLRQAEQRYLSRRPLEPWLHAAQTSAIKQQQKATTKTNRQTNPSNRENQQEKAKNISSSTSQTEQQQRGWVEQWLRSATSDFFWRFFVGLQMRVENVKIVWIQDGIEVGLVLPMNTMFNQHNNSISINGNNNTSMNMNGDPTPVEDWRPGTSHRTAASLDGASLLNSPGTNTNNGSANSTQTPANRLESSIEYNNKERVDKHVKHTGVGIYVRKLTGEERHRALVCASTQLDFVPLDVQSSDYMLRPVDIHWNFSLLFPQTKGKSDQTSVHLDMPHLERARTVPVAPSSTLSNVNDDSVSLTSTDEEYDDGNNGNPSLKRQRRGKRDKGTIASTTIATASFLGGTASENLCESPRIEPVTSKTSSSLPLAESVISPGSRLISPTKRLRRMSAFIGSKNKTDGLRASFRSDQSSVGTGPVRNDSILSPLPLVQPRDFDAMYALRIRENGQSGCPRMHGNVSVGDVQLVCSSKHFYLMGTFLAAGVKMKNGRPNATISSILYGKEFSVRQSNPIRNPGVKDYVLNMTDPDQDVDKALRVVVRSWWRYALRVVCRELRQRKRLRAIFHQTFLAFSWRLQCYRRREYVALFILSRLQKTIAVTALSKSAEEKLLAFEDELHIEQILLYRSIARELFVRGAREMPMNFLDFAKMKGSADDGDKICEAKKLVESDGNHTSSHDGSPECEERLTSKDAPCFLTRLKAQGEIARERRDADPNAPLSRYLPLGNGNDFRSATNGRETIPLSVASDWRSTKSRTPIPATESDAMKSNVGMTFSLSLEVKKLEVMIVENDFTSPDVDGSSAANNSVHGENSLAMSEMSVLTEDDCFVCQKHDINILLSDEEKSTDPYFCTTDYLLSENIEKVILQTEIANFSSSFVSKYGRSAFLHFRIERLLAKGEDGTHLVEMGAHSNDVIPVQETRIPMENELYTPSRLTKQPRHDAIVLSIAEEGDGSCLQCDTAVVRSWVDTVSMAKLAAFSRDSMHSVFFPSPLLNKSPKENVRLYVLKQNELPLAGLNCSVRIKGCEISFANDEASFASDAGYNRSVSSSEASPRDPTIVLRCDIMELYCGKSVEELSISMDNRGPRSVRKQTEHQKGATRQLCMLDPVNLLASTKPMHFFHGVIATKCVDIRLHINRAKHLSIFKTPIDFEIFYSGNPDSLFNSNQAKHDVTIELSSVRILLSEERLHMLSQSSYSGWSKHWQAEALDTKKDDAVPPRLEVLSNLFPLNIDLSVCRISVSLLSVNDLKSITPVDVKIISVKESMAGFLQVAAGFNLSYPNDEALSSAMQICIDRLVGLGFSIDDAWEATNSVLLNFLESMADVKQEVEAESDAQSVDDSIAIDEEFVFLRIQKSVQQVAILFAPALDVEYSSRDLYDEDAVLDFADGVTLKFVKLYYDSHACLSVPTLFLSNKSGLHLIRVSPQESDSDEYSPVDHGSDFSNQANESFVVDSTSLHQPPNGLIFRLFSLDENFLFGTGGLPLVIVGTDVALDARERRSQETLIDVEMGDIEFLFAHTIGLDLLNSVTRTCSPLKRQGNPLPVNEVSLSRPSSISSRVTFSGTISSSSILCLSDDLKPFTRFFASDILARADLSLHQVEHLQRDRERMHGSFASCQSVGLLNLTPEGELFPTLVSSMNDTDNKCLQIRVNTDGDIDIVFEGFRIFFLNQFVNELLQFFINGDYGFGLLLKSFTKHRDSKGKLDSSRRCILSFRGTSILLPRSSLSYDMLCLEVDKLSLTSSKAATTFAVPSSSERLFVERENTCSEASLGETSEKPIPRIRILLEGLRILSSLHDTGMIQDIIHHSPSFRFYFTIDGHAKAGKLVYCPIIHSGIDLEDDPSVNMAMAQRRWKELTIESTFLEIFVDRVPHVRILICDPVDCDTRSGLQLDILLSQFCMMLSVFFSNMQELPITFPLSVMQLRDGASSNSMPLVPEYGSEEFRSFLSELVGLTTEIAVVVDVISFRSGFDRDIEENSPKKISIYLRNAVVHVINDLSGVCRVSSGCCSVRLIDESLPFSSVLEVGNESACAESWADMCFGLQRNLQALPRILPQAFQFSAFILPGCVLYNIGMNQPSITLSNLSPVFQFLDFISSYFSDPQFGNPSFETSERVAAIKQELMHTEPSSAKMKKHSASSVEFRLWLARPALSIPCDPDDMNCPAVCLKSTGGLWYKLSIQDKILSSHECAADGMQLVLDNLDSIRHSTDDVYKARNLVENLSLGIRLDFNSELSHNDVNVQIPFIDHGACDLTSPRICVSPTVLSSPSICKPFEQPDRFLGAEVCEFTLVIDVLPLTLSTLLTFFSVASDPPAIPDTAPPDMLATSSTSVKRDSTFSIVARVADVRMFLLDPILGAHLPVAMASVSTVSVTLSQFATDESYEAGLSCESPSDLQAIVAGHFWIDSFKLGQTRSWEPLIERYKFNGMHERSGLRGNGLLLNSNSSFHVNVSSALLVVLDDIINALNGLITETFESSTTAKSTASQANATTLAILHDTFNGNHMVHDLPVPLLSNARAAFSLRNKTGQCVRIFRPPENVTTSSQSSPGVLTYLNHSETTKLSYVPSVSRVKNLQVTEVRFPGVTRTSHQDIEIIPEHTVDLQLPGFKWIKDIAVDTFGRSFASIVPKRSTVLQKVENDWRLDNVMNVLVEVSLHNGGRQVTVRSLITIVNTTRHMINLMFNTSPVCKPNQTLNNRSRDVALIPDAEIGQGESFQVPALLFESALRSTGNHLGSMWLKPSVDVSNRHAMQCFANDADDLVVDFSSKPVQFSRLVGESAAFFDASTGHDLAPDQIVSGMQLSCPVVEQTGFRLAPFCYVLEVERSPIVQAMTKVKAGSKKARRTHCPVAYSLMIHAPYTISNFLSTAARFELLHAVNRTVLWFGDLKPGEEIPIHSVGLDIPLVLFLNLGFAKTPVGEGALVHHGSDQPRGVRDNLGIRSIGIAGKVVTKQLGKTLTSLAESPDKRGQNKLFKGPLRDATKTKSAHAMNPPLKNDLGWDADAEGIDSVSGKTFKVDTFQFTPEDVESETAVVDGLGQRLRLSLENTRGGGGNRRIAVFCQYWILNTTEHCLRYKQENSNNFVSGTAHSPDRDGSAQLYGNEFLIQKSRLGDLLTNRTIFGGKPGALATFPGQCRLPPSRVAHLLDSNLAHEELSQLAFMFDFQEGSILTIGQQKLCVQLGDGTGTTTYESNWSRGFSLESVGIPQIVWMHCKDGRALELSVVVNVPSGLLSNYTKIVQFLPRFLVVNNLPYPIRLWQDSSIFRPHSYNQGDFLERFSRWRFPTRDNEADHSNKVNQYEGLWGRETVLDERELGKMRIETAADKSALYITTVFPTEIIPFILPDSRGDRQIRMDVGLPWALTSSFSTDIAGDHILKIKEATDMRLLSHVSTRSNPVYDVVLPESGDTSFDGELGIWFETEWVTGRSLIVTAVKKNSYSFTETDIQVGDELFAIDDIPTSRLTFIDAMQLLRIKLLGVASKQPPSALLNKATAAHLSTKGSNPSNDAHTGIVVLKFRTMEERLRMVRMKAVDGGTEKQRSLSSTRFDEIDLPNSRGSDLFDIHEKDRYVQAELKTLPQSFVGMILVLRDEPSVPFAIENRSCKYTLFYRQKGCHHLAWLSLKPSRSNRYSWDEPLKPKRLIVRVGLSKIDYVDSNKGLTWQAHRNVDDGNKRKGGKVEEDARFSNSIGIPLEEIGFCDFLSVSKKDNAIVASHLIKLHVDVVGGLRVLMINDVSERKDEEDLSLYVESIGRKVAIESDRMEKLRILRLSLDQSPFINDNIRIFSATEELMGTFPDETRVTKCHQLFVEVLEAGGLCPGTVDGACNPYAEVSLQTGVHDRKIIFKRTDVRQTYHVRKSIDPSWIAQSFVFDVPQDAVLEARGYSVNVRLRSFRRFRKHTSLGRAIVDLQNVRSQGFVEGWFPLSSRGGRLELENRRSLWGRGSIRLRIRWIHSEIALVEYFTELSERRQQELKEDLEVATQQVVKLREEEEEKNARMDTFRAVRVQEYQLSPRINLMTRSALAERVKLTKSAIIRLVDPLRPRLVQSFVSTKNFRSKETMVIESDPARMLTFAIPEKTEAAKKRFHASTESTKTLVDRLLLQRKMIRCVSRIWTQKLIRTSTSGNVTVTVSSLKSWSAVRAIFNDDQIESEINDFYIKIMLRGEKAILDSEKSLHMRGLSPIEEKLCSPLSVPYVKRIETDSYAANFIQSRRQFDRIACVSLNTILHSGGWLTIRPMTARNLPDPFTGMVVRAKFGGQSLTTESVDSKFLDPSWFLPDPLVDLEEQWNVICPNDLSIRVSAQTTSGSIRLSVLGERSQQLNSRIELGMLQLPIGLAIAACMDCMESKKRNSSVPLMYVRWFPLTNPKGAVHVDENDEGRSKESEKLSSDLFHNHFAPCIQLGIVWTPTTDDRNGVTLLEEATLPRPENLPPTIRSYVKVDVSQISVALIDSHRTCELISLTIQDIDVCYWITQAKTRMSVICGWIQVDYQDEHAREPVVLAPTPVDIVGPVLQTLALKSNAQSDSDVVSFDFIDISLAEFDLTIEERLLLDLVAFVDFISRRKTANLQVKTAIDDAYQQKYLNPFSTVNFPPLFEVLKPESDSETEQPGKIYIKQLLLGSIKVNLSYLKGKSRDVVWTDSKVDGILGIGDGKSALEHIFHSGDIPNIPLAWSQHTFDDDLRVNGTVDKFRNLAELLANLFPTVSDAPIRLSGKALDHTFLRPAETVENICKFYVNETMKQIYKIVGSLDFVGNPTMFVTSFYSGMRDFLLVPSVAFMSSPTDPSRVGLGVATGAMSLFFHSLSGFFGVVANLSAAAGHGVAYLSLDTDFREWHRDKVVIETTNLNREWKRRGVQHVGRMLTTPIMDILLGVTGGISGLVISPLKGYRKKGNLGMAGGVLVGGVGFFAKPTVGILDAVTHFTASIHDIAKSVNVLDRRLQPVSKVRLPYTFGMSTILAPYDATIARAAYLLKRFSRHETRRGVDGSGETIVHVEVLPSMGNEAFVIVTTFRTILVRVKNGATSMMAPTLCWEVEFSKSVFVSSRVEDYGHNSVALIVLKHRNCTMAEEQEKDGGSLPALSPLPSAKSLVSIPDENLQARTSHLEDFDQSNSRATDGDLLDWYSILAEYQYRRQLTRLHNVISCISGDFASVVFDPSLTRPGSNEGYTSFGMFHFEKNEAQRSEFSNRLPIYAESLPWVNMVAFRESMAKAQNETVCMERLREQHSLLEEMEASRKEGGPDWLIVARATVLFENNNVPSSSLLLSDRNSEPSLLKGSLITRKVSFVEAEGQGQSTDDTLSSSFRPYYSARFNLTGSMVTDDALLFEESSQKSPLRRDDNDNNIGVNLQSHDESLPFHHRFIRSSSDSRISGAGDGALVPSDEMSRFDESRPNDQPFPMRRHSCLTLSPSSFSDEFFDASQSSALTYPFESIAKEKASVDRENEPGARIETEITMTGNNPDMIAESQPKPLKTERMTEMAATDSSENQEVLRPSSRSTAPADRMDRMETLLERLLIFSSEQALMHNDLQPRQRDAATNPYGGGAAADTTAASNTRSDTDDLRREIRELRDMMARLALQQQQQQELQQHVRQDASTMEDEEEDVVDVDDVNLRLELSVLRQEVASLRQHQQQSKKRKNIFGNGAAMALASTRSSARSGQQKEQQQNSPQKPNVGIEQID